MQKKIRKMEKRETFSKMTIHIKRTMGVVVLLVALLPARAYAASDVTKPLNQLKTLFTSVVAVIGAIILIKHIVDMANAYQQQDSASMNAALRGIVGGAIMACIGTVFSFLGF